MSSEFSPEALAKVRQAFKQQMMVYALHDRDNADARTATLLHKHGLLTSAKPPDVPADVIAMLGDASHPARLPVPPGPLLFHHSGGGKALVLKVADFLMSQAPSVRKAALSYFEDLAGREEKVLTRRSRDVMAAQRVRLLSSDEAVWRSAAVHLADVIKTDWLCNLAGVRQCLARRFDEGIGPFLTAVFRPQVASVDSIDLGIWSPSSQGDALEKAIRECAEQARSLGEALNLYYDKVGHLPLAGPFGMARVVDDWLRREPRSRDAWEAVWAWAKDVCSPVAYYHASTVFAQRPELVPQGKHPVLWTRISHIVHLPLDEKDEVGSTQAWMLRCELARHFCHHLECRLPGAERERIACLALWLGEQTALALDSHPQWVRQVRSTTVATELEMSRTMSQLAHPVGLPARLHYCMCFVPSVWRLSLFALIGERFSELRPGSMSMASQRRLREAITGDATLCFPLYPKEPSAALYAFDGGVKAFTEAWIEFDKQASQRAREYLAALTRALGTLGQTDALKEELRRLPLDNEASQLVVSVVLQGLVYSGDAPAKQLWDCVSEEAFRKKLLANGSETALHALTNALIEVQVQEWGDWASSLPHFFAEAAEETGEEGDRTRFLFACTVLASMSTDTVSAVERLLRGPQRTRFRAPADSWLKQVDAVRNVAPPWIAGRLRALTAALTSA